MESETMPVHDEPGPTAPAAAEPTVRVHGAAVHIRDLITERPSIVAYLRTISPSKQEIALLHALEVGITELAARRERFQH